MKTFNKIRFSIAMVVSLIATLIFLSSWKYPQSIGREPQDQDTTKRKGITKKEAQYSRKTIVTFDENGEPHEEIVENFKGNEELKEMLKDDFQFDFPGIPPIADLNIPDFSGNFIVPPMPNDFLDFDTLDFKQFHFDGQSFEAFGEDFRALMDERFKEFGPEFEASMNQMQEQLRKMDSNFDDQFEGINKNLSEDLLRLNEDLQNKINSDQLREELGDISETHSTWNSRIKDFEKAAQKELVKDGYLNAEEKIESISWSDDEIKFNGKAIKEEHVDKYCDLRQKLLRRNPYQGKPE